jgi:hypothetical protein
MRMAGYMKLDAPWRHCGLPENLSDWVGQDMLIRLTLNAVDMVEDPQIHRASLVCEIPSLPPRVALTLLVYCYAVGIHGSHEIENRLQHDATLRYLSIGRSPTADGLRRFRNKNRELIAGCLGRVCCAVGRMHLAAGRVYPVLPARLSGRPLRRFEKLAELHCLCEARQRVTQAELEDGLWLEVNASKALPQTSSGRWLAKWPGH